MSDAPPLDTLGRPIRDLRVSVTDRCNFRCVYCMPKEVFGRDYQFFDRSEILTFEEITRIARIFVSLGCEKIRITGGEPLVRRDLPRLVSLLTGIDGVQDVTLTTNGSLLVQQAGQLRAAGLRRITVSLDSLDDATFRAMNDVDFPVSVVLDGIEEARRAGFDPVKINVVVRRGLNESSVLEMARYFRRDGFVLRFIEYMDVGATNHWTMKDVVPAREVVQMIDRVMPLEPLTPLYRGEVARRYRYREGPGGIGVISSVTEPFCSDCTRARISSDGSLYTCLFATAGHDLRALLRGGSSDQDIRERIAGIWTRRDDRYSEIRSTASAEGRVEMSRIGG